MGAVVYIRGELTSFCCAHLLFRGYSRVKKKLLLLSGGGRRNGLSRGTGSSTWRECHRFPGSCRPPEREHRLAAHDDTLVLLSESRQNQCKRTLRGWWLLAFSFANLPELFGEI